MSIFIFTNLYFHLFLQIRETWHPLYRKHFLDRSMKLAQECRRGFYHYQRGFKDDSGVRMMGEKREIKCNLGASVFKFMMDFIHQFVNTWSDLFCQTLDEWIGPLVAFFSSKRENQYRSWVVYFDNGTIQWFVTHCKVAIVIIWCQKQLLVPLSDSAQYNGNPFRFTD